MAPDPTLDSNCILLAEAEGTTLFSHALLQAATRLPCPGIVIFVHGVNSDGEWYEQAEQGLCAGLNARLKRRDEDLVIPGPAAGQMQAAAYARELTDDGFLNPKRNATALLQADDGNSPVIRFRWGDKANGEELQAFGDGIYLNEKNDWGGGPFANGCSALPDLWNQGLSEELFLWMHIQHMNPRNDRQVYACPPRPYFVFAAWRLARLSNPQEIIVNGNTGRQKYAARTQTLKTFFNILRTRAAMQQDAALVDEYSANRKPERKDSYTAAFDRADYGLQGSTYGRATLYFNLHDQVISATPASRA